MKQENITKHKCLMFVFCIVLVVSGILLIFIGVNGVNAGCNGCDLTEFLGSTPVAASSIAILSGILIIVIPYFGCAGAIKENYSMVRMFGILLFFMIVIQTVGAFIAYSYPTQFADNRMPTENFLKKNMEDSIAQQKSNPMKIWEEMQQRLKCCGVSGHDDYLNKNITIPASCFNQNETYDGEQRFTADKAYKPGCYIVLVNEIKDKINMVGHAAAIIALIETYGCTLSQKLYFAIIRVKGTYLV